MKIRKLFLSIAFALVAGGATAAVAQDLPKPQLRFVGTSDGVNNGVAVRGYEFEVVNREEFDNELFIPSPALPPCGSNANASRTWVNIFNEKGARLYGWCVINSNADLASLRFLVEAARPQPKKIYIELLDRFEVRFARSNTVSIN